MIITIDGPAGTGKSTVARRLAEALGFVYFDTGAMYRALTAMILRDGLDYQAKEQVLPLLEGFRFHIIHSDQGLRYLVGDEDLTEVIRSPEVTRWVSPVAAQPFIRESLVPIQRQFATETDAVFEGRDLGSVVFPEANLKVYLTASPETRAERRFLELQKRLGERAPTQEQVLEEILQRDHLDSTRAHSPLVEPRGAYVCDTSQMTIDEVVQTLLRAWHQQASQT
jgi:CMP/dCMP kinase